MPTPKVIKSATMSSSNEEILRPLNWFAGSRNIDEAFYPPRNRGGNNITDTVKNPGFEYFNLELKAHALTTSSESEEGEQEHRLSTTMDRPAALTHSETLPGDVDEHRRKGWYEDVVRSMIRPPLADEKTIQSPGG